MNQKKKKKKKKKEERKEGSSTDNIPPIFAVRPVSGTGSLLQPPTPTDGAEPRDPAGWVLGIGSQGDPLGCTKVVEPLDIFYLNLLNILLCIMSAPVQSVLGTEVRGYDLYRGKGTHIGYFLTEVLIAWIWGLDLEDRQEAKCVPEFFSSSSEPLRISRAQGRLRLGRAPRLNGRRGRG